MVFYGDLSHLTSKPFESDNLLKSKATFKSHEFESTIALHRVFIYLFSIHNLLI